MRYLVVVAACALAAGGMIASALGQPPEAAGAAAPVLKGVEKIVRDAAALRPLVTTYPAAQFLLAAPKLPHVEPRTLFVNKEKREWFTAKQAAALAEGERAGLTERPVDEDLYYNTKYGSPLAYVRALEVVAGCGATPALEDLHGKRIFDYGYGTVGHLRILARAGAETVGVDVDPFLAALYSEESDQGPVDGFGSVKLVSGRWPAESAAKEAVAAGGGGAAGGYDLIISKNTLKNGYLHPAKEVDKRMLVDLGVSEEEFLRAMYGVLKPGGLVLIYNLSPAEAREGEKYKPWADGRCPFSREQFEKAGFRVTAFDVNDDAEARKMGRALGWDAEGMDLEGDLFGHYTIVQRPLAIAPR